MIAISSIVPILKRKMNKRHFQIMNVH